VWTWATPQKTWSGKVWPTFGEDCPPPTTAGGVGLDTSCSGEAANATVAGEDR
jgi:hypothetical protein